MSHFYTVLGSANDKRTLFLKLPYLTQYVRGSVLK